MNRSKKMALCFMLIDLLAQGKSESLQEITNAAKNRNLISYLSQKYNIFFLSLFPDLSDLENEISSFDFHSDPEKYGISSFENGLALLLTLLVQELAQ